jgi:hypothetical protein
MIKLNAGFSRKVGEPNYGSRGASVNVELELESGLIGDPAGLAERIHKLFDIARQAVDSELSGASAPGDSPPRVDAPQPNGAARRNGNGAPRVATASQLRAIRAIGQRQQVDVDRLAQQCYRVNGIDELTLPEASALIDELKAAPAASNGGRR